MADYFFDTSVLVAYFKKDLQTRDVIARVLDNQSTAAVSAITVTELRPSSEMVDETMRGDGEAVLEFCEIVPVNEAVAKRGGELRRQYNVALPDALIAACAEQAGGRFLTKDLHFNRLVKVGILQGEVYE
jgi:predicted nucleic acid-binding protein